MRQAGAVVVAIALAVVGGLVLGEYQFSGATPIAMGVLFGLVVAEAVAWIAKSEARWLTGVAMLAAAGGLLYAGWISVHHRHQGLPAGAWLAALLGVAAVILRMRVAAAPRGGSRSRSRS